MQCIYRDLIIFAKDKEKRNVKNPREEKLNKVFKKEVEDNA